MAGKGRGRGREGLKISKNFDPRFTVFCVFFAVHFLCGQGFTLFVWTNRGTLNLSCYQQCLSK